MTKSIRTSFGSQFSRISSGLADVVLQLKLGPHVAKRQLLTSEMRRFLVLKLSLGGEVMHSRFAKAANSLDASYKVLIKMKPVTLATMPKAMPTRGIYLFSEGKNHLYVGRSNKLNKRPLRHCGTYRMAAFAFRLAREATGFLKPSYRAGGESRKGLMQNPKFVTEFNRAKDRIRKMDLRFVEEEDQTKQALLEIYCAVALQAPYNDFNTH